MIKTESLPGGYLNEKWEVLTDTGRLAVKKFSLQRYPGKRLDAVEASLKRQVMLREMGLPCPRVYPHGGTVIQRLADGTAYMAMDYIEGETRDSATVTIPQMESLGKVCGLMHRCFAELDGEGIPSEEEITTKALWENYFDRLREAKAGIKAHPEERSCIEYLEAVKLQKPILESLSDDFFMRLPKGIAHRDFAADNILFSGDQVAAVLDFDTVRHAYLWQDTGRALASFALNEEGVDKGKLTAFAMGYAQFLPFSFSDAVDSLRFTWCLETGWWVRHNFFTEDREKVRRFKNELVWLARLWFELDA